MTFPKAPYAEVIGDPIAQSKSPAIHTFWLGALGISARYDRALVTAGGLAEYLAARRVDPDWRGCNVTMPHKQAVIALIDRLDPIAAKIGAVNTVVRESDGTLTGYNTDAPGFMEPLASHLAEPHLLRMARVLGTGGAARAIVAALAQAGFVIVLAGRCAQSARDLLDELAPGGDHHAIALDHFVDPSDFAFDDRTQLFDVIVNATPLGMTGQAPLAFDFSHAPPNSMVYDLVTSPLDTAFLQGARAAGFPTVDGLSMLIGQADVAFTHFFGARPPRDRDADLRRLILG